MSNNFEKTGDDIDWQRYCQIIEESDVAAFGMTDYFSADLFFDFVEEHGRRYPNSAKLFFPVIEVRLNEAVNTAGEDVNFHILFRPDISRARVTAFLSALLTVKTDENGRKLSCVDLTNAELLRGASVTREAIEDAHRTVFGTTPRTENAITLVPSNNDGIRAEKTNQRKREVADQIDKAADLIFGNASNSKWFLSKSRYENGAGKSHPKPVVTGSDAHNYGDLVDWLGQSASPPNQKFVTWIKADLTYEGLLQTLVEPEGRVKIGDAAPDFKEPYRRIDRIEFEHGDFPSQVVFNPNLTSIIGSRSSGKSALLAYVAHAIDPDYTLDQQQAVFPKLKRSDLGPAAGHTWVSVEGVHRKVVWAHPDATEGKVIYVPQNSLYEISTRPAEITEKIRPALFRAYPELRRTFLDFEAKLIAMDGELRASIEDWFAKKRDIQDRAKALGELGDKGALTSTAEDLEAQIADLRLKSSLSDAEMTTHNDAKRRIGAFRDIEEQFVRDLDGLSRFVTVGSDSARSAHIEIDLGTSPPVDLLSADIRDRVTKLLDDARAELQRSLSGLLVDEQARVATALEESVAAQDAIATEHAALFSKVDGLASTTDLETRLSGYKDALTAISAQERAIAEAELGLTESASRVIGGLELKDELHENLKKVFAASPRSVESMTFGLALGTPPDRAEWLSEGFHKQAGTVFLTPDRQGLNQAYIREKPIEFLEALNSGAQRIRQGEDVLAVAVRTLGESPEVRFTAVLEGDQIGGFEPPTMTPGKQALFALTLMLSESEERWPLLLDQPEDDLDSRSIYEVIVPYLEERKRERQVIMVSHNANLVVGADSEEVIVANRHGQDRRNRDERRFDYKSGSLEHSEVERVSSITLDSRGISEHACAILDGGTDAFEKRKNKYNIKWS